MDNDIIERCLALGCLSLLQDNEGVVVIVDNERFLIWIDPDKTGRTLRLREIEEDESFFKNASMTGEKEEDLKSGLKVWVHPDTVQ
jgi:hypothetical protein